MLRNRSRTGRIVDQQLSCTPVSREISGEDSRALEAVAEYVARGPIALERLTVDESSSEPRVILRSPKFHPRHGSDSRSFDPLEFLATLMPHIPGTHEKTFLYYGYYSNRSRGLRKQQQGAARRARRRGAPEPGPEPVGPPDPEGLRSRPARLPEVPGASCG